MDSVILKAATRLLVGLILVFAAYLLFRGHNAPGGGFVAALVAATGFALMAVSEGPAVVRAAIRVSPGRMAAGGLGLAMLCGIAGSLSGHPFLTGLWWFVGAGGEEALAIGTPLVFDIGVYLVVLGAVLSITFALEEAV